MQQTSMKTLAIYIDKNNIGTFILIQDSVFLTKRQSGFSVVVFTTFAIQPIPSSSVWSHIVLDCSATTLHMIYSLTLTFSRFNFKLFLRNPSNLKSSSICSLKYQRILLIIQTLKPTLTYLPKISASTTLWVCFLVKFSI